MKKILLVCCLLLGIAAVGRAQGMRRSPEERAKQLQTQLTYRRSDSKDHRDIHRYEFKNG